MNEQWNKALEQVEDEYLLEAAGYRRKRHWPKVAGAVAAVLVLAAGWSALQPEPLTVDPTGGNVATNAPGVVEPDAAEPGGAPGSGFWDFLLEGNTSGSESEITYGAQEVPNATKTSHFSTYEEFQEACLEQREWFLHEQVMVPCLDGQPLEVEKITASEREMYELPWVLYFTSENPHITIRIPTMPSLTADIAPDTSGAEALRQLLPDAPNLHNREAHMDSYSEIQEVRITTSEGAKNALLRREADRDRTYLTFLQNGTLVTIAGAEKALEGDWLERFSLIPVNRI